MTVEPESADDLATRADELALQAKSFRGLFEGVQKAKRRSTIALVVALLVAFGGGVFGARVYADFVRQDLFEQACGLINVKAVGPIHDLLDSAKSAATRNPLPTDISEAQRVAYEQARSRAQKLYDDGLSATEPIDCKALL